MDDPSAPIRKAIRAGELPGTDCLVAWHGPGRGQMCTVCGARILGSELAVECELTEGTTVWFHARCYSAWRSALRA